MSDIDCGEADAEATAMERSDYSRESRRDEAARASTRRIPPSVLVGLRDRVTAAKPSTRPALKFLIPRAHTLSRPMDGCTHAVQTDGWIRFVGYRQLSEI